MENQLKNLPFLLTETVTWKKLNDLKSNSKWSIIQKTTGVTRLQPPGVVPRREKKVCVTKLGRVCNALKNTTQFQPFKEPAEDGNQAEDEYLAEDERTKTRAIYHNAGKPHRFES